MISFIVRIYVEHLVDSEICQLNQKKIKHINQLNETYIFHKAEIRWYESQIDAAEITQKFEHCLCFHHPLIIPKVQFGHFLKFGKTTVPRLVISFSSFSSFHTSRRFSTSYFTILTSTLSTLTQKFHNWWMKRMKNYRFELFFDAQLSWEWTKSSTD